MNRNNIINLIALSIFIITTLEMIVMPSNFRDVLIFPYGLLTILCGGFAYLQGLSEHRDDLCGLGLGFFVFSLIVITSVMITGRIN